MFKKYVLIASLSLVFSSAALAFAAQVNYNDPYTGSIKKIIIQNHLNNMHIRVLKALIHAEMIREVNNKFALSNQMIACGSESGNRILSDLDFTNSCSQQNFDNDSGLMQFYLTSTKDKGHV